MSNPTEISAVLYSTSNCTFCRVLTRKLTALGIEPTVISLDDNPVAYDLVTKTLGFTAAPVTVISGVYDWPSYFQGANPTVTMDIAAKLKDTDFTVVPADIDPETALPHGVAVADLYRLNIKDSQVS